MEDTTLQSTTTGRLPIPTGTTPERSSSLSHRLTEKDASKSASAAPSASGAAPTRDVLERIIEDLSEQLASGRGIRFRVSDSDDLVVQVVDRASDKVIRSIPPERLMEFAENVDAISKGVLLDDFA